MTLRLYLLLLAGVGAERLVELVRSRRHTRRALLHGAVEHGRSHYPLMVGLHALFLPACAIEALVRRRAPGAWSLVFVAGVALAQALRLWVVRTLGERWTTRVIVTPGAPRIARGPYRFLDHPNYLAVAVEVACLPLAYGGFVTALLFSLANAALLRTRIRVEERALASLVRA